MRWVNTYKLFIRDDEIYETENLIEAIRVADSENSVWCEYVEDCIKNEEPYIDKEIFVYRVEPDGSLTPYYSSCGFVN